jgi:hypothetical protein
MEAGVITESRLENQVKYGALLTVSSFKLAGVYSTL